MFPLYNENIAWYVAVALVSFSDTLLRDREVRSQPGFFVFSYLFRLSMGGLMMWLLLNRYGGGDLTTYYLGAIDVAAQTNGLDDWVELVGNLGSGALFVQAAFALVFEVFPPSLYGLNILASTISWFASLHLHKTFRDSTRYPRLLRSYIFLSPSNTIQSCYLGKETLVLWLIAWFLHRLKTRGIGLKGGVGIALIWMVRVYNAVFVAGMATVWTLRAQRWSRLIIVPVLIVVVYVSASRLVGDIYSRGFTLAGFGEYLAFSYTGGSLVLEPWDFPLGLLQSFRPFPWEANSLFALCVSLEVMLVFFTVAWLTLKRFATYIQYLRHSPFFLAVSSYVVVWLFVMSFTWNMGDLARRRAYYFPLLVAAATYSQRRTILKR